MTTGAIVGSGPNGLAAAIRLAQAGVSVTVYEATDRVGGGVQSSELTIPGLRHDDCSVSMPAAIASPFFASLGLEHHGLTWSHAPIEIAHPLNGEAAGLVYRDLDATAAALGEDGRRWSRLFSQFVDHPAALAATAFAPVASWPRHPATFARLGVASLPSADFQARRFRTERARSLFGGIAAHSFMPLTSPMSSAVGVMLGALAHTVGWAFPVGGAQSLTQALVAKLLDLGGTIETGRPVTNVAELGADITIITVPPVAAADMLPSLPAPVTRAWRAFRPGPAAYKIDLAVESHVPWADEAVNDAGVVHVGGTFAEMRAAEAATSRGKMPDRPFILTAQPHVADPSRTVDGVIPFYLYAHVPNGWDRDETERILARVEQFAPGLRERVVGMHVRGPAALEAHNSAYVGGDIAGGASSMRQLISRPRIGFAGYRTGVRGVYLGGASTSPGAGVHGMSGATAAECALRDWGAL